jgi:hypothetical protein
MILLPNISYFILHVPVGDIASRFIELAARPLSVENLILQDGKLIQR